MPRRKMPSTADRLREVFVDSHGSPDRVLTEADFDGWKADGCPPFLDYDADQKVIVAAYLEAKD